MSRVYFHSPAGTAELRGSEREWLNHLASGPAEAAWGLGGPSGFERAVEILAMVPEVPDGGYGAYLHTLTGRSGVSPWARCGSGVRGRGWPLTR